MATQIPANYKDLFEKNAFAHLATIQPDGSPQVSPVWFEFDGTHIIINSVRGRQKDKNMRRDARVSLAISDPQNPYRYVEVRGRIVKTTEQGGAAHIDKLAKKYMGVDQYPYHNAKDVRTIYHIEPLHVTGMGS